ncbi:MAG: ATP-binding protein [Holophagales bacterium]|nr:ATP-binding protein [Holophagales bacterium]
MDESESIGGDPLRRRPLGLDLGNRILGPRIAADEEILQPGDARRARAERWERLHRFHLPILRLLGFGLLSFGVFVYNRFFAHAGVEGDLWSVRFALAALAYSFLCWPLMYWGWGRIPHLDLLSFLADVPLLLAAVYVTGGEESWLVSVLLLRVADQAPYGTRRAFAFSAITTGGFLALLLYLGFVEGRPLDWQRELAKLLLLGAAGLYVALTARGSDLQRRRISRTMALTRDLIRRLELARDEARAASVAKGHFLANMSHELRTPLNAVVGIADLLLRGRLDHEQRHRVRLLQSSANALLGVLGDVLDFSKIEASRMPLAREPLCLVAVARECRELFEPQALASGVELELELELDLPRVLGDSARLRQVLVNLLGNAFKFTAEGRIVLRTKRLRGLPMQVRIEVEDSGCGIPSEALAALFDPFTQVDTSASRAGTGTGLGLAICHRLTQLMGGKIGVDSEEGRGSLFWLELPFEPAASDEPAPVPQPAGLPAAGHVLLVEDNEVNRFVASSMLEELGMTVSAAEDGYVALDLCELERFDLILMDCQMPGLDGYETTRRLRGRESGGERVPIIALTADVREENRRLCQEAGMDHYLSKPLRLDDLRCCLEQWGPRSRSRVFPTP